MLTNGRKGITATGERRLASIRFEGDKVVLAVEEETVRNVDRFEQILCEPFGMKFNSKEN